MGGNGILTIKEANMMEFSELLTDYYNTGNGTQLKQLLYDNAIEGIEY
jgi:hypothetical protein